MFLRQFEYINLKSTLGFGTLKSNGDIYTLVLDRDLVHGSKLTFSLGYWTNSFSFSQLQFSVKLRFWFKHRILDENFYNLSKYILKETEALKERMFLMFHPFKGMKIGNGVDKSS